MWGTINDKYGCDVDRFTYWGTVGASIGLLLPYFYLATKYPHSLFIPFFFYDPKTIRI